jgi:hypothetical protein
MARKYAERTKVPVTQSRAEIEKIFEPFGTTMHLHCGNCAGTGKKLSDFGHRVWEIGIRSVENHEAQEDAYAHSQDEQRIRQSCATAFARRWS